MQSRSDGIQSLAVFVGANERFYRTDGSGTPLCAGRKRCEYKKKHDPSVANANLRVSQKSGPSSIVRLAAVELLEIYNGVHGGITTSEAGA